MRQSTVFTHSRDWELISNIHFIVLFGVIFITTSLRRNVIDRLFRPMLIECLFMRLGLAFSRSRSTHVSEVIWFPTGVTCFSLRRTIHFPTRVRPCVTTIATLSNTGWRCGRFMNKLWFMIRFIPVFVRVYSMNIRVMRHSILNIMCTVFWRFECTCLRKNVF